MFLSSISALVRNTYPRRRLSSGRFQYVPLLKYFPSSTKHLSDIVHHLSPLVINLHTNWLSRPFSRSQRACTLLLLLFCTSFRLPKPWSELSVTFSFVISVLSMTRDAFIVFSRIWSKSSRIYPRSRRRTCAPRPGEVGRANRFAGDS